MSKKKWIIVAASILVVVAVAIAAGVVVYETNKIPYHAEIYNDIEDYMREEFIITHLTKEGFYTDKDGNEYSGDVSDPTDIVYFISNEQQFSEVFLQFPVEVDFDSEMIVVYMFSAYTRREMVIESITLNEETLIMSVKSKERRGYIPDCTAPHQRYFAIKMDKVNVKEVNVNGFSAINGGNTEGEEEKNDTTENKKIEEQDADIIELHTWHFTSGGWSNAIVLKYSDDRVVYECGADKGSFIVVGYSNTQPYEAVKRPIITMPGETIYWDHYEPDIKKVIDVDLAYADFILKLDNKIIGYAVIKITPEDGGYLVYNAEILKAKVFKNLLGQYTDVTEEYVTSLIEQVKAEN
ncbi:MAG: hypothetical protein J1F36_04360 [Clostridiales bacterium]|nr:hypothetical protein [Clostridiales bacterium]